MEGSVQLSTQRQKKTVVHIFKSQPFTSHACLCFTTGHMHISKAKHSTAAMQDSYFHPAIWMPGTGLVKILWIKTMEPEFSEHQYLLLQLTLSHQVPIIQSGIL